MSSAIDATVKWFNNVKGFGFLTDPEGTDYFVHHTAIDPESDWAREANDGKVTLRALQNVRIHSYIQEGKGPRATKVEKMP